MSRSRLLVAFAAALVAASPGGAGRPGGAAPTTPAPPTASGARAPTARSTPLGGPTAPGPARPTGAASATASTGHPQPAALAPASEGYQLYDRFCLACHGAAGDGNGPAKPWLWPPPRDFVKGPFKWRSVRGSLGPERAEVAAAVAFGVRGTSMPGFADTLDERQRQLVVDVVLAFAGSSGRVGRGRAAPVAPPPVDPARVILGARLWHERGCAICHGPSGRGDGVVAPGLRDSQGRAAPPYDFSYGVRRPHPPDQPEQTRRAIARSVVTGLAGTAMPAFDLPEAEFWALVDYVASLAAPPRSTPALPPVPADAIAADRSQPLTAALWPGGGEPSAAQVFGGAVPPQGTPPPALAPAQASLSWQQCARCHAAQAAQWRGSIHAAAYSPGLRAQYLPGGAAGLDAEAVAGCQRCHGPLAEQISHRADDRGGWAPAPEYSAALAAEGVTCASCHVRGWSRLGPPRRSPSLLSLPGYPSREVALYERADLCLPCHQLPARQDVSGRPLLDTYREWLLGPYMRRGVQCQHCHMPNREHWFRGVHDPDTVRQAAQLRGQARRGADGVITVWVAVVNVGAGHYLPTTPTPALWLVVELLDGRGQPVPAARSRTRIGRKLELVAGALRQVEDTRVPPGGELAVERAWRGPALAGAARVKLTLEVWPDDYYEGFYRAQLAVEKVPAARELYQQALARAQASRFIALEQLLELAR